MFPARWYSATDRKSMSNNSSCARFEEKLHSTTLHSTGTHTEFPLTKVPDISITLSWMRRKRASYVQANNSPSMPFKGCLPSSALYCNEREMQHALASTVPAIRWNVHTSSESNASNRVLESYASSHFLA